MSNTSDDKSKEMITYGNPSNQIKNGDPKDLTFEQVTSLETLGVKQD